MSPPRHLLKAGRRSAVKSITSQSSPSKRRLGPSSAVCGAPSGDRPIGGLSPPHYLTKEGGVVDPPTARLQRGPSEAARCASTGINQAALPPTARIEGAHSATGKRRVLARLGWAGVQVRPLRARKGTRPLAHLSIPRVARARRANQEAFPIRPRSWSRETTGRYPNSIGSTFTSNFSLRCSLPASMVSRVAFTLCRAESPSGDFTRICQRWRPRIRSTEAGMGPSTVI